MLGCTNTAIDTSCRLSKCSSYFVRAKYMLQLSAPYAVNHMTHPAVACVLPVQMTAFAARLALDCQRVQGGYLDCLPCIHLSPHKLRSRTPEGLAKPQPADAPGVETMVRHIDTALSQMPAADSLPLDSASPAAVDADGGQVPAPDGAPAPSSSDQPLAVTDRLKALGRSLKRRLKGLKAAGSKEGSRQDWEQQAVGVTPALHWYMEHVHAPLLAQPLAQLLVLAFFVGLFVLSLAALPHVSR